MTGSRTFVAHFISDYPAAFEITDLMDRHAFNFEHFLADKLPIHAANLRHALVGFPADLILAESFFFGTLPILLRGEVKRPAVAHLGVSVLNVHSGKNIPLREGVTMEHARAERERYERVVLQPTQIAFDRSLRKLGVGPLPCPALESLSTLADLYVHPGIESFEYPNNSSKVHYIGQLPLAKGQTPLPEWWNEIDRTMRLVLVTQGTIENRDLGQLVGPALTGLAEENDLVVLVTTGGQTAEAIPVDIPQNARVAPFLPFEEIFPHIDLLITNGGYGTVNMALAHGIPIVTAGLSQDKEEVSAHIQWAGVGIDLHTTQADPASVRRAVRRVLDEPHYRKRAAEMAVEFASSNAEESLLRLVETCGRQA
jgi:UDP:flavonoid glycosyltransferase YjiC (YdhE family)